MIQRKDSSAIPPSIAAKLAASAHHSDSAVVVGNRAGVIEWANEAWTRVTGYALDESISKPVTAFLDDNEIDPGIADFVGRCFAEGKLCELEVQLDAPDGRALQVLLRVEPLLDESGEPSDFVATAIDLERVADPKAQPALEVVDLSVLAAEASERCRGALGERTQFEFELDPDLPEVVADPSVLEDLVSRLICRAAEAIDDEWGLVTVGTGVLGAAPGPIHFGDALAGLEPGHYVYLEVHDSAPDTHPEAVEHMSEPFLASAFPRHSVRRHTAELLLRSLGGELRIQSARWSGSSVLLILPFA